MSAKTFIFATLGTVALSLGCNQPFSPKGMFQDRMVVYCVLSTRSDTVYARVLESYDAHGFDPLASKNERVLSDAVVTISGPDGAVVLRDTIVQRDDTTRYGPTAKSYVGYRFPVRAGSAYTLGVSSTTKGSVTGTTTIPDSGFVLISPVSGGVMDNPFTVRNQDIIISVTYSIRAKGLLTRMFVEFESGGVVRQEEVPGGLVQVGDTVQPVYPSLGRAFVGNSTLRTRGVIFSHDAYVWFLRSIKLRYWPVKYRRARFTMTQVDPGLYDYYSVVNGFRDRYSTRTDIPDYTNIGGGLGVFGSFTTDSTFHQLPQDIPLPP